MKCAGIDVHKAVEARIAMAKQKQIFKKASEVAREFGKHTTPSYRDSGETFYNDQWDFEEDGLTIWLHQGYFGHEDLIIGYESRTVFEYRNGQIWTYVPEEEWENRLEKFYAPVVKKAQKEQRAREKDLRKRFGL